MAANGALKIKKNIISLGTRASAPAGAVKGDIYITAAGTIQVHNGSGFGSLSSNEDAATLQNKTIVAPIFSSYTDFAEIATPVSPAAGNVRVYAKSDKKLYQKDSLGAEALIGSGSGGSSGTGVNLIDNPDDASNWGVSGGVTASTVTANNPLAGVTDTAIELAAGSVNDYARYRFTLPNGLKNTPLVVSLYTGASVSDDWEVEMFSNTLSNYTGTYAELPLPSSLVKSGQGQFRTFFVPDSVNVYHELRFKRVAGSSVLRATAVTVGPQALSNGAAVSDWQSYTPVVLNLGSGSGTTAGFWRRTGDNLEVVINFTKDAVAGTGGSLVTFGPPPGLSGLLDSAKNNTSEIGFVVNNTDTPVIRYGVCTSGPGITGYQIRSPAAALTGSAFTANSNWVLRVSYPIVGWSSNVTMADRAVEEYAFNTSVTDASDTTSFGYGSGGTQGIFGVTSLTASRSKLVRFATPIQPTDSLFLEIQRDGGAWLPHNANDAGSLGYVAQGSTAGGMYFAQVNETDVNVWFAPYAVLINPVFGGAGFAWSSLATGYRWRVRKVSGGAAVGFPVSGKNILNSNGSLAMNPVTGAWSLGGSDVTAPIVLKSQGGSASYTLTPTGQAVAGQKTFYTNSGSGSQTDNIATVDIQATNGSAVTITVVVAMNRPGASQNIGGVYVLTAYASNSAGTGYFEVVADPYPRTTAAVPAAPTLAWSGAGLTRTLQLTTPGGFFVVNAEVSFVDRIGGEVALL